MEGLNGVHGKRCVFGRGGVCVHAKREGVYMEVCMHGERGMCIWKGGVCAW